MSRWSRFDWYESAPKKPPPERGIRMKQAGTTWWGQRWIEALQNVLRGDSACLARGRTYARAGRTHDLVIKGTKVTAKVTGSRAAPYKITIELTELSTSAWEKAIDGLAQKAQFSAELLAGQMPQTIDEVFVEAGESLCSQSSAPISRRAARAPIGAIRASTSLRRTMCSARRSIATRSCSSSYAEEPRLKCSTHCALRVVA